jgi:histone acetyltransferase MYST1
LIILKSGYGKFIISTSYELTKREGKTGSPEKPLSDLGKMAYRSYWTHVLMNVLAAPNASSLSIETISTKTGIKVEDIISTLQSLDMIKSWKGQHVVHVKQSVLKAYLKQEYVVGVYVVLYAYLVLETQHSILVLAKSFDCATANT